METFTKNNNKFLNFKNPVMGDIICIEMYDDNIWLYVIGTNTNTKEIIVSSIEINFEDMFNNTYRLNIEENNFIYIGPPENSKIKLSTSLIKHSKIVKEKWYNEINYISQKHESDY